MSSARPERWLSSTSARLAIVYALLMVAAFSFAGLAAWFATRTAAEQQIRERVELEMSALQEEMQVEGLPAVITAIRTRSESPGALEYRLFDAQGGVLIGDLPVSAPILGWTFMDLEDSHELKEGEEDLLVFAQPTPNGGVLVIADDLLHAERVRSAVLASIFWVGGLALILALAAGVIAARGALQRMDALSSALALVGAGDLSARAPERTGGDDIDAIGRGVNQMLGRIDALVANVRRVSTSIAHDLRTPLTHVRQQLEAASVAPDREAANEAIQAAQSKIDDILRTFAAMLRLAEIEAGAARSRFASVDVPSLVERVVDAYRPDIEAGGGVAQVVMDDQKFYVEGDADLIAQAVANLIENAMRHAGKGASITVRCSPAPTPRVEVEDNGVGVSADDRARIVEPFFRVDPSRATPGAGLGLSIVHAIARLHDAELRVEDALPGLRVVVTWPDMGGSPANRI